MVYRQNRFKIASGENKNLNICPCRKRAVDDFSDGAIPSGGKKYFFQARSKKCLKTKP